MTTRWLKSFQRYLLGRNLQWNTVSTYMRMLRAVYFRAVDAGKAPYHPRLFKGVYTGTRVTVKRAVDEVTLHRLSAECLPSNDCLDKTRMLFLLLLYKDQKLPLQELQIFSLLLLSLFLSTHH